MGFDDFGATVKSASGSLFKGFAAPSQVLCKGFSRFYVRGLARPSPGPGLGLRQAQIQAQSPKTLIKNLARRGWAVPWRPPGSLFKGSRFFNKGFLDWVDLVQILAGSLFKGFWARTSGSLLGFLL